MTRAKSQFLILQIHSYAISYFLPHPYLNRYLKKYISLNLDFLFLIIKLI